MTGTTNALTLGLLHPGSMGAAVGAQARANGFDVLWCLAGRSLATRTRARDAGLTATDSLSELAQRSDIIVSLCPPANAERVAEDVSAAGFRGTYVDANAISPKRAQRIEKIVMREAAAFVDASVIGSPPSQSKTASLYAVGPGEAVSALSSLFADTNVVVKLLDGGTGQASALKLAYSSFQKASRALAAVAHSLATSYGVDVELLDIAREHRTNYLLDTDYIPQLAARAWRWGPEMGEVADCLDAAGLPTGMADGAAAVMGRWTADKDQTLTVGDALDHLRQGLRSARNGEHGGFEPLT